jgi:long-subunit acyl-CoA synthetase (AMP-forming)
LSTANAGIAIDSSLFVCGLFAIARYRNRPETTAAAIHVSGWLQVATL